MTKLDDGIEQISDPNKDSVVKARKQGDSQESIAQIVKELPKGTHLTVQEVFERAKERGLDYSLSTVYRILHKLKLHGEVMTVGGDRGLRYETAEEGDDHDHLICLGCGLTIEFYDDLIRGFGKTVAQRKGFEHRSSRFDILGYCETCRAGDQARVIDQSADFLQNAVNLLEETLPVLRQSVDLLRARRLSKGVSSVEYCTDKLKQALEECESAHGLASAHSQHLVQHD